MDYLAWAADNAYLKNGSSGGFIRAMLHYMLDNQIVDRAIIARTGEADQKFAPRFVVIKNTSELSSRRVCSVYYPISPFELELDASLSYAITLLPCQVEQLRSRQRQGLWLNVEYVFELLCSGTPTVDWTKSVIYKVTSETPINVAYRGNGWPGFLSVSGKHVHYPRYTRDDLLPACKNCHLTYGDSDWLCADPWGIPKSNVGLGKTLVRVITTKAMRLTARAATDGAILEEPDGGLFNRRLLAHRGRHET